MDVKYHIKVLFWLAAVAAGPWKPKTTDKWLARHLARQAQRHDKQRTTSAKAGGEGIEGGGGPVCASDAAKIWFLIPLQRVEKAVNELYW